MDTTKLKLATTVEHEFYDGTKVECTLAMYRLKRLASKDKNLYKLAMKVLGNGTDDVFESIRMIYAAYICAHIDDEELMSEDEFTMMCGSDYIGINETVQGLIDPKKRMASGNRSN